MASLTSTPPRPEKKARAPAQLESRPGTWEQYRESQADIVELKDAKRVEALLGQSANYFALDPTTTPSPVRTTRPQHSSHLTPTSSSRPQSFSSPGTQLADQLARMSLGDSIGASGSGGRNGASQGRGQSNGGKAATTVVGQPSAAGGSASLELLNGAGGGLLAGGSAQSTVETPGEAGKLRRHASVDELALLVISSSMTELSMAIQEVNTMIFEIQELRHTTMPVVETTFLRAEAVGSSPPLRPSDSISNAPSELSLPPPAGSSDASSTAASGDKAPTGLSQVDEALMRLDSKLEVVGKEFSELEAQISPVFEESAGQEQADFLRRKWVATAAEWEGAQKDADILGEELKEDKWLTVFRSVSSQAEDMMKSLEKVLTQSHDFIFDLNRRQAKSSNGSTSTSDAPRSLVDLPRTPGGRSLGTSTSSILVEAPSLPSYFSDHTSMQPLLKSFIALHQSLHAKIKYYSPATDRVLKILGKGIADRSTKNGEVLRRYSEMKSRWRNLVDRIGRIEGEMRGVEEMLREAAGAAADAELLTPPKAPALAGPPLVERISPFRRLASKMTLRSSTPTNSPPPAAASRPSPSSSPATPKPKLRPSAAPVQSSAITTPPRPPKSASRYGSPEAADKVATLPRPPPSPGHRYSQSANLSSSGPTPSLAASTRSRRAPSPAPSADGYNKPRWNISTKRPDEKETLRESHLSASRPSLGGYGTPSRSLTSGTSGRQSVSGMRSSSRMSLSQSFGRASIGGNRAPSPAFSNFSDASSYARERPMTPSRIPAPASASSSRFHASGAFSSLMDDEEPTSLLQRTMSPTPSSSSHPHLNVSPSPSSHGLNQSRSRLPTPSSGGLHPPRGVSPSPSSASSAAYLTRGQTPEPRLMAQANRLSFVRAPHSRPPPVPSLPANLRDSTSTPKGTRRPSAVSSRPSSSLSSRPAQTSSAPPSQPYTPNPLDPLDQHVATVVNSLPILLHVERLDPPVTRATAGQDANLSARYLLALGTLDQRRAIMCKLVDRVGPRSMKGAKKVLVRVGGGYQDLESYAFSLLATSL